jgi:hypothetical protein
MHPGQPITLVLTLALATACAGSNAERTGYTERDSADVRIVESTRPAWPAGKGWSVDSTLVTIGTMEGAPGHQLHRVMGAVRLANGTLVIANGGSAQLLRYDSSGSFLGATGREGGGPGEFRALSWIGRLHGDSLVTWDRGVNRVTIFAPTGMHSRDYKPTLPANSIDLDLTSLHAKGLLSGGRILLTRGASFASADGTAGVQRQPATAWILDSAGKAITSLGPFPGEAIFLAPGKTPGSITRTPIPLGAATFLAAGSDAVHVVDTDVFAVRMYGTDGKLSTIARRPYTPEPVQPTDIAAVIDAAMEDLPPVQWIRDGIRAGYERVPPPQHLPAISALHVDSEDNIWVQAGHHAGTADATWTVFNREGRWLGDVILPAALQLLEIGRDYVVARDRNDLDVERVRVMRLRRTSG